MGSSASAQKRFLAHTRAEEIAADRSGLRYMAQANVDPMAMAEVLEIFAGQEMLSAARQDPYVRTHPLSRDRIRAVEGFAAAVAEAGAPDPNAAYWFARARAKLSAYLRAPSSTLRRFDGDGSDAALVARAVAHSQNADGARARAAAEALIARRPEDAYARELLGWVLFEARAWDAAADAYEAAAALAPDEPLIAAGHGRALLARGDAARALEVLEAARARDPFNPGLLRDLAQAQARMGDEGAASLSTAERYALAGRLQEAAIHAKRATGLLPRGSTRWRRAEDIVNAAETQDRRN
jgi:predicted Zn-dependent protease